MVKEKNMVRKSIGKDYASMTSEINGNDKTYGAKNVDSKISTSVALRRRSLKLDVLKCLAEETLNNLPSPEQGLEFPAVSIALDTECQAMLVLAETNRVDDECRRMDMSIYQQHECLRPGK